MKRVLILLLIACFTVSAVYAQDEAPTVEWTAVGTDALIEAAFEEEVTAHLYAFHASEGDTLQITMTQLDDALDPFLVLFDNAGAVLAYDDDSGELPFSAQLDAVEIAEDGVYFVMATSVLFVDAIETATDDALAYQIQINGQTTPESVEDPSVITFDVQPLTIGEQVSGESTIEAPLALFFLNAEAGDNVTISLEDADFFTLLHVFAPDGSRLVADASLAELELDESGFYLIVATEQFFYESMDTDSFFEGGTFTLVIE
ncbi:MAG: PPC domain-containing protein [Anaerolineae bacterium]